MLKRVILSLLFLLIIVALGIPVFTHEYSSSATSKFYRSFARVATATNSDREQDGLMGPVRRVRTETAKVSSKDGKTVEGPRAVLETATYDIKGGKIDNAYFLTAGSSSLTGKEVYKYDERGNIIEMTLHNADGSVLSKEVYTYEFDAAGNWTKMTTSIVVVEGGKLVFEPTEVTYRTIAYYLEDTVSARMVQPAAQPNSAAAVSTPKPAAPTGAAGGKTEARPVSGAAPTVPAPPQSISRAAAAPPPVAATPDKTRLYASSTALLTASSTASGNAVMKVEGEAPSGPLPKAHVKPLSGGVLNGKATSLPAPAFPEIAKRARAAGTVSVEVVIDTTGKVISARAVSGPPLLHQAAERAATQARFSPSLLSGQPVKVFGTINYNFTLAQ